MPRTLGAQFVSALFAAGVVLAGSLEWDPHELALNWPGVEERVPTTSGATCAAALRAIRAGVWRIDGPGQLRAASCAPGDGFAPAEACIAGYNCRSGARR